MVLCSCFLSKQQIFYSYISFDIILIYTYVSFFCGHKLFPIAGKQSYNMWFITHKIAFWKRALSFSLSLSLLLYFSLSLSLFFEHFSSSFFSITVGGEIWKCRRFISLPLYCIGISIYTNKYVYAFVRWISCMGITELETMRYYYYSMPLLHASNLIQFNSVHFS